MTTDERQLLAVGTGVEVMIFEIDFSLLVLKWRKSGDLRI